MKNVYPVILTPAENGIYIVSVPDFEINTQGENLADAIAMARDAIEIMGVSFEDENKAVPTPSHLSKMTPKDFEIATLVDVDFIAYRKKYDTRTERRNISLPRWLNTMAKERGINVSEIAQKALIVALGLED